MNTQSSWNIEKVRSAFPALALTDDGQPRIYLDAPGGSQVANRVIERMHDALINSCANDGGVFRTSVASEALMFQAHEGAAAFLGASPEEIVFGLNTTTLFFGFAYILSRDWKSGDEIVLTRMDHDANIAPWLRVAEEKGVKVRWLEIDQDNFHYRYDMLDDIITSRTKLVACNHASNLLGTVSDVKRIVAAGRAVGAVTIVDAVQSAPHIPIDVKAIGCDILSCSAYKFFGPHAAILYLREELRDRLQPLKVRPAPNEMPWRFAPGTPSFEAQAGTLGAIEHFAWLGDEFGGATSSATLRSRILGGIEASQQYEANLMRHFLEGVSEISGFQIYGPGNHNNVSERIPTFSFRLANSSREKVVNALAEQNVFSWTGSFYAHEIERIFGLQKDGGANRIGFAHYNSYDDVDALVNVLKKLS